MSDNDFDDGLPSFFGGKNRTGYRQMAANIIDPTSFTTRKRENAATGETVTLRTKGGMHRVEVIPGDSVKKFEVPLISKFVATPSSKRYSGGYTPPAMPAYPGPFSEWKNWHAKSTPPDPESAVSSSSRLIPVALFDDAQLAMAQLAKLAQYRAAQQAIGQAGVAEQARFAGEARGFHRLTPCDETERPGTGPGPADGHGWGYV